MKSNKENMSLYLVIMLGCFVSFTKHGGSNQQMVSKKNKKSHRKFRGSTGALICDTCNKVKVPKGKTRCRNCLAGNLS